MLAGEHDFRQRIARFRGGGLDEDGPVQPAARLDSTAAPTVGELRRRQRGSLSTPGASLTPSGACGGPGGLAGGSAAAPGRHGCHRIGKWRIRLRERRDTVRRDEVRHGRLQQHRRAVDRGREPGKSATERPARETADTRTSPFVDGLQASA